METKVTFKGMMAIGATAIAAAMLPHGALAQPRVCPEINALGGSVPGVRCIKTADIGNRQISSNRLQANITVGFDNDAGDFGVRETSSEEALLFEVNSTTDEVTVGRGGGAGSDTQADTDLVVFDPDSTSATEPVLRFDASQGTLVLGSGNITSLNGEDGSVSLEDGLGRLTVDLDGSSARILLGDTTRPGEFRMFDNAGSAAIELDADTGDVTNPLFGDGLVKAWCRINADGTFDSGFRCNSSVAETRKLSGTGTYEVDFTPLSSAISDRPHVVSCSDGGFLVSCEEITSVRRNGDASSLFVRTLNSDGIEVDSAFTVVIF